MAANDTTTDREVHTWVPLEHPDYAVKDGDPVTIDGQKGDFDFQRLVKTPKGDWVEVIGGPAGRVRAQRSFDPARVLVDVPCGPRGGIRQLRIAEYTDQQAAS